MSKTSATKKISKAEKKAQITISVSGDVVPSGASKRKVNNRVEKVSASDGDSGRASNDNIK